MKEIFKILIAVTFFFLTHIAAAQTFKDSGASNNISGFNTQASQESFLLGLDNKVNKGLAMENNSVYVTQVGNSNSLSSTTKSQEGNMVVIQSGNLKKVFLELNSIKLTEAVIQNGNNNTFLDYSLFKSDVRNAEVNQTGNNQNLKYWGRSKDSNKRRKR